MNEHIVVITGASPLDPTVLAWIPPDALVMAVDGGLDHALNVGLEPRYLVGDLDSVTDDGLTWAARHASIDRHPTDKDRTDTELALVLAATLDPDRITLIGGGDRLDHTIAAIGSLGALSVTSVPTLDAWWGTQHIRVVQGPGAATLRLVPGSTLSLLALHGPCTHVTLRGTRWELDRVDLEPIVGLGVSNEVPAGDGPSMRQARSPSRSRCQCRPARSRSSTSPPRKPPCDERTYRQVAASLIAAGGRSDAGECRHSLVTLAACSSDGSGTTTESTVGDVAVGEAPVPPTVTTRVDTGIDGARFHHTGRLRVVPRGRHVTQRGTRSLHRGDRHRRRRPRRRGHRHDAGQGVTHRREPGGRRDVGRRRHPAPARRRRRSVRAVCRVGNRRRLGRDRRGVPRASRRTARQRRSTTATCA